mgnify:CR=1 FL=1
MRLVEFSPKYHYNIINNKYNIMSISKYIKSGGKMKKIILASKSPRRQSLLKNIGVEFTVIAHEIDEDSVSEKYPEETAQELSYRKAMYIAKNMVNDCIVIGADTIVVCNGILGKPADKEEAVNMLTRLQGNWHQVITGISVVESLTMNCVKTYEKTFVKMRNLTQDTIKAYVNTGEPMDKAGAYGVQGFGSLLIEKIEGCYFNVVGLPIAKLGKIVEKFGISFL